MFVNYFYRAIAYWVYTFGDPQMTRFWEHRGYRAVIGGKWGSWNMGQGFMQVKMWIPSPCDHYPKPLLANHDDPIAIEEYIINYPYYWTPFFPTES